MSATRPRLAEQFDGAVGIWRYEKAKRFVRFVYKYWQGGDLMMVVKAHRKSGYDHDFWTAVTQAINDQRPTGHRQESEPGVYTVDVIVDLIELIEETR